jgi:hypothetical protein
MVAEPCPPPLDLPPPVRAFNAAFIAPGKVDMPRMLALTKDPAFVAYNAAKSAREAADWAGLCRYRRDNDAIVASGKLQGRCSSATPSPRTGCWAIQACSGRT